eukprot:s1136_g26.t1
MAFGAFGDVMFADSWIQAEKAVKADGMFPSLLKELKVNSGLPGTVSGCDDEFWHFNALYSGVNVTGALETAVHFNGDLSM